VSDVPAFATNLQQEYSSDSAVCRFHDYFTSTWLNGYFHLRLWNQYDVPAMLRTNNAVETWHSRFNRIVRVAHPNVFVFISFVQREERNTSAVVHNANVGVPKRLRVSKYNTLHKRIQALYDAHRDGTISTRELFRRARHVVHTFN
jgi:hypothetical protein